MIGTEQRIWRIWCEFLWTIVRLCPSTSTRSRCMGWRHLNRRRNLMHRAREFILDLLLAGREKGSSTTHSSRKKCNSADCNENKDHSHKRLFTNHALKRMKSCSAKDIRSTAVRQKDQGEREKTTCETFRIDLDRRASTNIFSFLNYAISLFPSITSIV